MFFLFWLTLCVLFYTFFVYPLLILILSIFVKRPVNKREIFPFVSLIVPFRNEEKVIKRKIENIKSLDYPQDKLEVIFVCDGSEDNSLDILKRNRENYFKIIEFKERKGKWFALNEAVKNAKGEVLVFSDASGIMNRIALREMVKNFNDKDVGGVLGIYRVCKEGCSLIDFSEQKYWDFELFLKQREAQIYTTIGGHGALYSIRRSLFKELPPHTVNEDFVIPAYVCLQNRRVVYEEKSVLYDIVDTGIKEEFRRRIRISFGNWQQMVLLKELFNPRRGFLCWQFISHKVLRTLYSFAFILWMISTPFNKGAFYKFILSFQILFVFLIVLGLLSLKYKTLKRFNIFLLLGIGIISGVIGGYKFFFKKKIRW